MEIVQKIKAMSRLKKFVIAGMAFLVVFTIVGFFILPHVVKLILVKNLSEKLHREVIIQDIDVNPYVLSLAVKGFVIKDRESSETFASFEELYINVQTISVFKWALIVRELKIERPYVNILRNEDTRYNFSDLIKEKNAKSTPLRFSLNNIQLFNGRIDIWDRPKHKKHQITDVNITIPFVSNLPYRVDAFVQPLFAAKFNETSVSLKGKTKPFADSLETILDVDLRDIDVPYYLAYIPLELNFKILKGYLDTKATISYVQPADAPPTLSIAGDVVLRTTEIVDAKDKPVLKLPMLHISIASAELISRRIHLSEVLFQSPEVDILRDKTGKTNIQSILPVRKTKKTVPENEKSLRPLSIDVDEIKLAAGKVFFSDFSGNKPFETTLEPVNVSISHFSNAKDKKAAFNLSLQTEANEIVKLYGEFCFDPLISEGTLELETVPLKKYSPYYMDNITFVVEDGNLELQTGFKYAKDDNGSELTLSDMSASLDSVSLKRGADKEPFIKIPILSIKGTKFDLKKRELTVGELLTKKGLLNCVRDRNGDLNLNTLFRRVGPSTEESTQTESHKGEKPWCVTLTKVLTEDYTIKAEDLTPPEPVTLMVDKLKVSAQDISTVENRRGKLELACQLNRKGTISAKATVGINPIFTDLDLKLKSVDIDWLQPYFRDQLRIIVTNGTFSTTGKLSLAYSKDRGLGATYRGQAVLSDLASVDKLYTDDFIRWEALRINDIDLGYNPIYININEIALDNFYACMIVNPDGKLNLQTVVKEKKEEETLPPKKDEKIVTPIRIEKVTFKGGHIKFLDRKIDPDYSADLVEIGGAISGLSSEEAELADVLFRGKLDNYAPIDITGKINPLTEDLFADLQIEVKDIDLSPITPYAGRYVGYTIQKGKLFLDLKYLIEKRKLDSQNNVFLDQLTFGDKVESPDAVKLPVKLAVSLLKNRNGEIDLHLPVTGSIDDPKFSVGRIIVKILMNLLAKAATSPFALLGAVFGGGEELSSLEFDHGSFNILGRTEKKLDTLIKALYDRPSLKLDVEGHVDVEKDKEGLRKYMFDKKLKVQKLKEMMKKGLPAVPVDEVKIEPDEYERYLKKAYKAEKFAKPRNILGFAKKLPVPEMEKLLLEHIEAKDDDLRLLALERAQRVKDYILRSGKIEPERIFLIAPKSLAPDKKEHLRDSRVDLKLK